MLWRVLTHFPDIFQVLKKCCACWWGIATVIIEKRYWFVRKTWNGFIFLIGPLGCVVRIVYSRVYCLFLLPFKLVILLTFPTPLLFSALVLWRREKQDKLWCSLLMRTVTSCRAAAPKMYSHMNDRWVHTCFQATRLPSTWCKRKKHSHFLHPEATRHLIQGPGPWLSTTHHHEHDVSQQLHGALRSNLSSPFPTHHSAFGNANQVRTCVCIMNTNKSYMTSSSTVMYHIYQKRELLPSGSHGVVCREPLFICHQQYETQRKRERALASLGFHNFSSCLTRQLLFSMHG